MRRRLTENPPEFLKGVYSGGLNIELSPEDGVLELDSHCLWNLARDSTNAIRREIEKKQFLQRHYESSILSIFI